MASLVAPGRKKRRPNFSSEFKKALAQQACEPGVSVSQLAQENGVNVNMLFKWRRYLLAGLFDAPAQPQAMLPVTIVEAPTLAAPVAKASRQVASVVLPVSDSGAAGQGMIEIQIAETTVRFDGHVDLSTLRAVVRMLRA